MTRYCKRLHWAAMTLALGIVLPGAASGSSELGLDGVGLEARFVEPGSADGTIGLGALVDLGGFTDNVRLEGRVDFWSYSEDVDYGLGSSGEATARDIAVGARTRYVFPVSHPSCARSPAPGWASTSCTPRPASPNRTSAA